jgi:hypothetical protein
MVPTLQNITSELADNWPAFTYILMTLVFSVCFFRERRTEKKNVSARFDRLESLILQAPDERP